MRVLFLHRWVGLHEGGTETSVKNSILFLVGCGHEVCLITTKGNALPQDIANNPRIRVYYLPLGLGESRFSYSSMYDLRLYLYTAWYALRLLVKVSFLFISGQFRPDILSIHFSTEALVALIIRFLFRVPFSFALEGYTTMEAKLAKLANVQFSCSNDVAQKCQKNFDYTPIVRWHGANLDRFSPEGANFKKQFFLESDFVVLSVCRLEPRKNIATLIRAAKITNQTESDIKYLLVGEGVEGEMLRNLVNQLNLNQIVKFAGRVAEEDLPAYYRTGDIYVLPTLYEGFGIVYAEAMASGLPIISTNAGAVPEVVGEAGILLDPMDEVGFAREITNLYHDSSRRSQLREQGLALVRERYDVVGQMAKFEDGLIKAAITHKI